MDTLLRVIPFFLLIACGLAVARLRLIDLPGARALSAYVFWVAFPALLVHSLATRPPPDGGMAASLGAYALAASLPLFIAVLLGRLLGWSREARAGAGMASVNGNTAFLGAPLAVSLFGSEALGHAAMVVAVDTSIIMALAAGTLRSAAHADPFWKAALKTLRNPLVVAALVGLAIARAGLVIPAPLERPLGMLAVTASPVGLVALGVVLGLGGARPERAELPAVGTAVLLKLLTAPALVWFALGLVGADPLFRVVATLLAACPTAVNVFIQTRAYDVFARGGALTVLLTTAVAAASLPLIGALLRG